MKCSVCKNDWKIERLCPLCWTKLIDAHIEDENWVCSVCGTEISMKVEGFEDQERITAVLCHNCRVMYVPM